MATPSRLGSATRAALLASVAYVLLAAVYTWPLLSQLSTAFPSDPGDPVFNASILLWNATTLPFTPSWWTAPHYFPTESVAAFTENLQGISLIATPVYWLTGSPIAAHNVAYLLTWPLSGIAVYLLVAYLTNRRDAAFVGGLAFAFTPYRTTEIAHIQSLSAFWLPVALLAAHAYLRDAGRRWLWIFALAWLLQSLSNGHYMLFGAVVIGAWLAYFASTASHWRRGAGLLAVWGLASLPLIPILLTYSRVHVQYGLKRHLNEILAYSARPHSWFEVTGDVWFWRQFMSPGKDALFPGVGALLCVVAAAVVLSRRPHVAASPGRAVKWTRAGVIAIALTGAAAIVAGLWQGPWATSVLGVAVRMANLNRAVVVTIASLVVVAALTPRVRAAFGRRSPFIFYSLMVLIIAVFCVGPVLYVGDVAMLQPAPYRWLMFLPGFDELRAPPRFWMLGIMCLATAAGLGLNAIAPIRSRTPVMLAAALLVLLDGWMPAMRMAAAPVVMTLEPADDPRPILELPLGVDWDWDATYRAAVHRRRVFNGVSGYDPPHYDALRVGLAQRDPGMLTALATLGEYDVVVNADEDREGLSARYVSDVPGAVRIRTDGSRTLYRIPRQPPEPELGAPIAIAGVQAMRLSELFAERRNQAPELYDGRLDTGWDDYPQSAGQWVAIDLGGVHEVGGVTSSLGRGILAFPRRLEIQTSIDGRSWERAWQGLATASAALALIRNPLEGHMRFRFPVRNARFVRLLQLDDAPRAWHISELRVHAP